jgi:predicted GTPase
MQLGEIIERLNRFATEDASWEPLAGALPEVRRRIAWIQEQYERIPSPLVVLMFGGTGTGKSTLLNALAGAPIAETGEMRPTTDTPTVYHPAGVLNDFGPAAYVEDARLDNLILIDTPDTDSVRTEHAEMVLSLLARADVVVFCGTQEKYANERSIALLRPIMNERKIVPVQTHADVNPDIRDDWRARMIEEGFDIERAFRVSALDALNAKIENHSVSGSAVEFEALDEYIKKKLPPERRSVKEQNLGGAVINTVNALSTALEGRRKSLETLNDRLAKIETDIAQKSLQQVQRKVLDEPHVWVVALAAAVSERAFGLIGSLFRILHGLRMLPSRITRTLSPAGLLRPTSLRGAAKVGDRFLRTLAASFSAEHAEANAHLGREGFEPTLFEQWEKDFVEEMDAHLARYLEPVHRQLTRSATVLTRWTLPLFELLWLAPFVFTIGFPIYRYYAGLVGHMDVILPEAGFLSRSMGMLACIVFIELFLYSFLVRWRGRALRRRCMRYLRKGFGTSGFGFGAARREIDKAIGKVTELEKMREAVRTQV